jgi:hypothetical protein
VSKNNGEPENWDSILVPVGNKKKKTGTPVLVSIFSGTMIILYIFLHFIILFYFIFLGLGSRNPFKMIFRVF